MLPILEGEDFNAEPVPSLGCVSVSRNGSPLRDCVSPVTEKSSPSRCASVTLQRASSPTIVDNEAASAPASSLPSANCSRPTTAAGWTSVKSPTWQRQGASPAGALFLSAVVHSGTTTTLAAVQLPSHSSLPTAPGRLQDPAATFSKKLHADASLAPNARTPDPISAATSELLAAAAMRLSQQASQEPLPSFRPQQLQQLHQQPPAPQQNSRGPEPFRGPSPPPAAASAQQHPGPHLTGLGGAGGGSGVLWDTPGREQQTSSNAGFKAAAPPALNIGMLASGLLLQHNDVRRQLGARRMPSVVLESPSRRPLPSREVTITPVVPGTVGRSPSRLGDSAASPQHPQPHPISGALALAPLPSSFTSSPHAISCCYEGDSFGNNTEAGVGGGHGSHNQRQQFTPTTVSFARPAPLTLQPVHLRQRGGPTTLGFSATMSAPLPSVPLTAPNTAPGGTTCASTAQHHRATLPSWGSNRPAHGSPPSVDSEVPDQGLGLWNQGTVSVRVATVIQTLLVERNDNPKTGLTHVLHTQHMRLNAGGNGGGSGIVGAHGGSAATTALGTSAGALASSSSVDLTGSLRNHPQFQQFLQQHRHPKYDKLSQQQSEQEQAHLPHHQEQPQSPEESPGLIVRSMSLVVMPSMPRFTPLPQAQAAGPLLGSPKARSAVAAHRASAVSNGLQSRPSTSPPTSPSRSPPRSPCRSPPRSPGRQTQCGGPPSAAATVAATGTQPAAPDVAAAAGVGIAAGDIEPTVLAVQPIASTSLPQKQRGPQDQQQPEDTSPQHVCQHRGPNPDNPSDGIPAAAGSNSTAAPPPSQADTGPPQGSSTDSGEARHSPGNPMAASLPLHPPPALGPTLHKTLLHSAAHAPILLASASPTGPAHLGSYIFGGARNGAGMCVSAADGREGLPGHPLGRRMASKENGGQMLLKMHSQNQQRLQQQLLQRQLQQQLQDLEAEAAETEAEALIGSQTFSLRRTAYNDWVEGMPLKGTRRSAASIGGVVAGGVEGKAVVLKKQPPERGSALFLKQADRKPLLGGDVLHVL
ncbi:hypothetical protein Vretimale_3451 [Volvox reticuliferus]|uniref:Uncharacterized protein n=1 Tax=Volvox reticuliferus TaxID=1737510 RepID=A0A8J4D9Y4_9CHLO|nr:hypothetical protein Vretifemale_965 [Volvox reticuliferus]GIL98049.1 hypothetical protein Vretimale_3451 [Volvox reticuliferus]